VFTPFGLGVLDVALGKQVYDAAVAAGRGRWVPDFFAAG
jgi:ornithine cyclodeaminase/alanine dehydrogenase-like protein (mu-crystallin family)